MIVDTHAHIFSAAGPFAPGSRYQPGYDADIERWLGLWPEAGVTHGVLVQPSFLGTDNSRMLAAMEARPATLRGVVVVEPSVDHGQLRLWNRMGVRGVRLNLIGVADLKAYGGPEWVGLYERMIALGWHLEVQCEGERLPSLLSALPDMPIPLVIDHFGLPDPAAPLLCAGTDAVLKLAAVREIYVKLSAPYRLRGADPAVYAARYLAELGPERLLWGSDWPWTRHEQGRSYPACMDLFRLWVPSADARKLILEQAPRRLYGFDGLPDSA